MEARAKLHEDSKQIKDGMDNYIEGDLSDSYCAI